MALLFADGFDGKKFITSGNNWVQRPYVNYNGTPTFSTGRKGSGSAIKGIGSLASTHERYFVFPSALSVVIAGVAWRRPSSGSSAIPILYFGNNTSFVVNALCYSAATGIISFKRMTEFGTGGGQTTLASSTGGQIPTVGTWNYWEIKITSSTTAGSVQVLKDGGQIISATGLNTGSATIDRVGIHMGLFGSDATESDGVDAEWDDLYICDTTGTVNNDFFGDVDVLNRAPNANGTNSGLLGSDGNSTDNYALVTGGDPASTVAPDNATYVESTGIGSKDTYNYYDIPTTGVVKGVIVNSFVNKSDTANSTGRNVILHSGSTTNGADFALSTAFQETYTVLENVPGGTGWTPAQVNAAEFGWEHRTP